jgi:flagellar biosynthesis/type III secretory pathway protein FliH
VVDREAVFAEVTELLVSARAAAKAERAAAKDAALVLARKMAEKIVGRAVELDPTIMGEITGQALAASRLRGGAVVLRVHPDDLASVEQTRPQWAQRIATAADVHVVADESVERFGCVVATPVGARAGFGRMRAWPRLSRRAPAWPWRANCDGPKRVKPSWSIPAT